MYFSKNLSYLAEIRGLKKNFLAKELNLSPQQVGRYLSGESQPKMEGLVALGQYFDVAIDDLILVDLSSSEGRRFGQGSADRGGDVEAQTRELNKLLRLRLQQIEAALKKENPGLARELGIE